MDAESDRLALIMWLDVCVHVTDSGVLLIYCFIFHVGCELQCFVGINHKPPIE